MNAVHFVHRIGVGSLEPLEKKLMRPPSPRNTADVRECLRMIGELRTLLPHPAITPPNPNQRGLIN
jgi:hypothetical protein